MAHAPTLTHALASAVGGVLLRQKPFPSGQVPRALPPHRGTQDQPPSRGPSQSSSDPGQMDQGFFCVPSLKCPVVSMNSPKRGFYQMLLLSLGALLVELHLTSFSSVPDTPESVAQINALPTLTTFTSTGCTTLFLLAELATVRPPIMFDATDIIDRLTILVHACPTIDPRNPSPMTHLRFDPKSHLMSAPLQRLLRTRWSRLKHLETSGIPSVDHELMTRIAENEPQLEFLGVFDCENLVRDSVLLTV
ncbi:hypothetical protein BDK51DRAFT_42753 [Blyttiomyces helicus]|uniref:Uncharacterized protein n=1 Tax=Blyttiomyces helicus TaxID=388810 RepID=A0A4P9WJF6_9FUNG|nr:hypothetical protein BDK51DRAFT_42753 [Blyttiomyces helicus]|eukprot:RKO91628.1 hypothetical protein BDK51DRAFT_42753 [Blyttiomyces helicus]